MMGVNEKVALLMEGMVRYDFIIIISVVLMSCYCILYINY